ncbi:hypothetical protein BC828DRAFT_25590 [Blastocladiella britannica]|nr:hypothetical protein BC828DRAFT_25590 [Blastocladiella britannica]
MTQINIMVPQLALAAAPAKDPSENARGSPMRCGVGSNVLPDLAAMAPCWKGTVSRNGTSIADARSWLYNQFEYTYANAPAPTLSYYGYLVTTSHLGLEGETDCIFYEFASDMQVAGRWQPTCPTPAISGWAVTFFVFLALVILPFLPYAVCGCYLEAVSVLVRVCDRMAGLGSVDCSGRLTAVARTIASLWRRPRRQPSGADHILFDSRGGGEQFPPPYPIMFVALPPW